ncbi:SHOCT domain-containing protein [Deinococcus cellulosilyticus]|uniref:SHOCT domain-containing protein n=1 Tax=Deinococcus cellulosilyticus (strain DSM 18568 / NBRC 106333 / KACC 11606 / 5516J-15) TaxID=1223518 RepID=A0A511N1U3_DEIC1|nr:SHOCT domain-containing protein [Deinococcus cellulosilyticus]GEM46809.1 hypothetical protein DC3_24440 [Deinococcus cellulosilyticus NBRC 106333 = KACC 11606]
MFESGIGFGLGFLNFVGTVLFFVFIFGLLRMLAFGGPCGGRRHWKKMKHLRQQFGDHSNATHIVRERYARGEIDREEYQNLMAGLGVKKEEEVATEWRPPFMATDRALEVARYRLAQGEITPEEYEAIRKALES